MPTTDIFEKFEIVCSILNKTSILVDNMENTSNIELRNESKKLLHEIMKGAKDCGFSRGEIDEKYCCSNCKRPKLDTKRCTGCKKVWYCSKECQKKDWKLHKNKCKRIN